MGAPQVAAAAALVIASRGFDAGPPRATLSATFAYPPAT